jgi:hypothetical protein
MFPRHVHGTDYLVSLGRIWAEKHLNTAEIWNFSDNLLGESRANPFWAASRCFERKPFLTGVQPPNDFQSLETFARSLNFEVSILE